MRLSRTRADQLVPHRSGLMRRTGLFRKGAASHESLDFGWTGQIAEIGAVFGKEFGRDQLRILVRGLRNALARVSDPSLEPVQSVSGFRPVMWVFVSDSAVRCTSNPAETQEVRSWLSYGDPAWRCS